MIKVESTGHLNPRGDIQFDEYERNDFVARFLEAFNADISEAEQCARVYAIHLEIRHRCDLYIAVAENLSAGQRRALHVYAQCRGDLSKHLEQQQKLKANK